MTIASKIKETIVNKRYETLGEDFMMGLAHGREGHENKNPHKKGTKEHGDYEYGYHAGLTKSNRKLKEGPSYGMRTSAHFKLAAALEKAKKEREAKAAAAAKPKETVKEEVERWTGHMTYAKGSYSSKERKKETVEIPVSFHRQHYHQQHFVPSASHFMDQVHKHPIHTKMINNGYHLEHDQSHFKKGSGS